MKLIMILLMVIPISVLAETQKWTHLKHGESGSGSYDKAGLDKLAIERGFEGGSSLSYNPRKNMMYIVANDWIHQHGIQNPNFSRNTDVDSSNKIIDYTNITQIYTRHKSQIGVTGFAKRSYENVHGVGTFLSFKLGELRYIGDQQFKNQSGQLFSIPIFVPWNFTVTQLN